MPTSPEVKRPRDRAPSGVVTNRRLRVGLMPAELAELERRAEADGRTLAAMARIYLLRGMQLDRRGQTADDISGESADNHKES